MHWTLSFDNLFVISYLMLALQEGNEAALAYAGEESPSIIQFIGSKGSR